MCEQTKADVSENKLKMPISLQPPPVPALIAQPWPLIPCVNEWCPRNNTQSPPSIHLGLAISPSPLLLNNLLSALFPLLLDQASSPQLFLNFTSPLDFQSHITSMFQHTNRYLPHVDLVNMTSKLSVCTLALTIFQLTSQVCSTPLPAKIRAKMGLISHFDWTSYLKLEATLLI